MTRRGTLAARASTHTAATPPHKRTHVHPTTSGRIQQIRFFIEMRVPETEGLPEETASRQRYSVHHPLPRTARRKWSL